MAYYDKKFRDKLLEQKIARQLHKEKLLKESKDQDLNEEILKTSNEAKTFAIGDKVRILKGEKQGKIGSINYCNAGKCVVRLADEQLFVNVSDLDFASEKPLDEDMPLVEAEDDIQVKVDGEVVADTSTDDIESGEIALQPADEGTVEEYGPKLGITDLLLDAINDENEAIQKYNALLAACNEEGFVEIANVVKHITEEENIHVGMLQYAMSTISEQAKTIQTGNKEAEEIMNGNEDANHEEIQASEETEIVEEQFLAEKLNLDQYGKAAKRAIKNLVLDSDEELKEFVNAIIDEIIAERHAEED